MFCFQFSTEVPCSLIDFEEHFVRLKDSFITLIYFNLEEPNHLAKFVSVLPKQHMLN